MMRNGGEEIGMASYHKKRNMEFSVSFKAWLKRWDAYCYAIIGRFVVDGKMDGRLPECYCILYS